MSSAVNCWNYRFNSEEARAIDRLQLDMYNEIRQVHIIPDHDSSENQMRKNDNKLPEGSAFCMLLKKDKIQAAEAHRQTRQHIQR